MKLSLMVPRGTRKVSTVTAPRLSTGGADIYLEVDGHEVDGSRIAGFRYPNFDVIVFEEAADDGD